MAVCSLSVTASHVSQCSSLGSRFEESGSLLKERLLRLSEKEAGQGRKKLRLDPDLTRLQPGRCGTWK